LVGYVPEAVPDPVDRIPRADELIPIVALLHRWITLYVAGATGECTFPPLGSMVVENQGG
jgi:hypothetical protein